MVNQVQHVSCIASYCAIKGNVNDFLARLQPEIERLAAALGRRVFSLSIDVNDLTQEGMIGAWLATLKYDESKVKGTDSFRGYCLQHARGRMLNHLRARFKQPACSLEWLDTEIEDTRGPVLKTPAATRRRILAALQLLTERERAVIMAAYMIDDSRGRCSTPGDIRRRFHLSESAYYNARARALKRLARVL